jgi:hypothetical protein
MSPYFLGLILQSFLVTSMVFGPASTGGSDKETSSDIAKLEAEGLAKYSGDVPSVEQAATSAIAPAEAKVETSPDIAKLEAEVLEKYAGDLPSVVQTAASTKASADAKVETSSDIAKLGTEQTAASAVALAEAKAETSSDIAKLEAEVLAKYSGDLPSVEQATTSTVAPSEANAETSSDIAKLEAEVAAKYARDIPMVEQTAVSTFAPSEAKMESSSDIAKLEAEVMAKYSGDLPAVEQTAASTSIPSEAKVEASSAIAKLEAEVLAKYRGDLPSVEQAFASKPHELDSLWLAHNSMESMHAPDMSAVPLDKSEASDVNKEGTDSVSDRSAVADSSTSMLKVSRQNTGTTEVQSDVSSLEAAVLAKYSKETPSVEASLVEESTATSSAVNVLRQKPAAAPPANTLDDVTKLEAAMLEKYESELPSVEASQEAASSGTLLKASQKETTTQSSSTEQLMQENEVSGVTNFDGGVKDAESAFIHQPVQKGEVLAEASTGIAKPDASQKDAESISVGKPMQESVTPLNDNAKLEAVDQNSGQALGESAKLEAVAPTEGSMSTSVDDVKARQSADELSEIEEVFHVSKKNRESEQVDSTSPWRKLSRFGVGFLCVFSLICIVVQKYGCFAGSDKGKKGIIRYKAKQEDVDPECCGFAGPSYAPENKSRRRTWEVAESIVASVVSNGHRNLSRRTPLPM